MLKNSFYTIKELHQVQQEINATISFLPEHEIFKGHFPGQPVVPGVCMIQMIKEMMQEATQTGLIFRKGHQIKFLQMLVPENALPILVHISWTKEENNYNTQANFKKENSVIFKLNGVFSTINKDNP